jgi:hypothetical protein
MGYGLGKNSPVVLSLGRANYEAMIDRHGQWVRWRISKKCTCLTSTNSNYADPKCKKCGGSGERYDYQKEYNDSLRLSVAHRIIELPAEYADCEIVKVYDARGIEYTVQQMGQYAELSHPTSELRNGEVVEVTFRQSLSKHIEEAVLEYIGNGFYRVSGVRSDMSTIEGVEYRVAGDIIDLGRVCDAQGQAVDIIEYRRDTVRLKDSEAVQPLTAFGIQYIKPFTFVILSQDLNEVDEKLLALHGGQAVCTFPYRFNVSEGDVITVLSGSQTRKIVLKRKNATADDTVPEFFVDQVPYVETAVREYREGTDFIIIGENKLHWVCADPPEAGSIMSITYRYLPTYRVHKVVPMLRTSEDQRLPKKVLLNLFSDFSESKGVQKHG